MENAEKRQARALGAAERRVVDAEAKLQELSRYRAEYEQQFTARAGNGIGVAELRDYQAFLARLADAIRQQHSVVQRARSDRDAERMRWQDAARRTKAIDHVAAQWHAEEQRAADRRDQNETDERAQRALKPKLPNL